MEEETKIRLKFTMIIFLIALILIVGTVYDKYSDDVNVFKKVDRVYYDHRYENLKENYNSSTCKVQYPTNESKIIILRMDDISAFQYKKSSRVLVKDILDRDISVTLGLIPEGLANDKSTIKWLNILKKDIRIEIAQHGYDHSYEEFKALDEESASMKIEEGKKIIGYYLGIIPVTFIPPYNVNSKDTELALKESGYKILSSGSGSTNLTDENFGEMGYTSRTYIYGQDEYRNENSGSGFVDVEEVISDCKNSLNSQNLCVVMIHPQDYLKRDSNDKIMDEFDSVRYNNYLETLDKLEKLRQNENAEFKNFDDLLVC
ncbi:hypothetical protein COU57_02530 [Candidatus Pacearchaeota archaeon CG10_big_fil_rev_8_21_14_0_10_32_14]|nr:MAG: hypothetical protein COU57_02530 [Candidatus Pacearchaeota archaeon CG10_big_fil_rev_8_21_14_0_10_32_14]